MIGVTHSCDGNLWLDTPAMNATEFEGGFLLPHLMGALASELRAAPVTRKFNTHQNKTSVLKLYAPFFRALKLRFSPL
jgi:hypothetical protein